MARVKLLKQVGNRPKGEIINVDSASAASLVRKEVGEIVDDTATPDPQAERQAPRRGGVIVTQVVEEDNPNKPATDTEDGDELAEDDDSSEEDGDGGETSAGS